jgi:hypothetical protein
VYCYWLFEFNVKYLLKIEMNTLMISATRTKNTT